MAKGKSSKKIETRGRPSGQTLPNEDMRVRFPVRLSKREQDIIAEAARIEGLPASTWLRVVGLREANKIISPKHK